MKKKRLGNRKQINPFHSDDAIKTFESLYLRYIDTVYRIGLVALTKPGIHSDATLREFIAAFDELKLRTNGI